MAVMHPRIAGNYLKDGYYPTDELTLSKLARVLVCAPGFHRFLDPCCGEGLALAQLLKEVELEPDGRIDTLGVELNAPRAREAQLRLTRVLCSNVFDTVIGASSQSFLFLNPPYGDTVKGQDSQPKGMTRLEIQFTQRVLPTLKRGGVLALVIPAPSLTVSFSRYLSQRLDNVRVFRAETDRFKQVVILAEKQDRRGQRYQAHRDTLTHQLSQIGLGEVVPDPISDERLYRMRSLSPQPFRFEKVRPDRDELEKAFQENRGLWPSFGMTFDNGHRQYVPRPLRRLSAWHLSLSLAAGQISGLVTSNDGRTQLLVKGGTQKVQKTQTSVEGDQVVTTKIDQFVPLIRGIHVSPGEHHGHIVNIQ